MICRSEEKHDACFPTLAPQWWMIKKLTANRHHAKWPLVQSRDISKHKCQHYTVKNKIKLALF